MNERPIFGSRLSTGSVRSWVSWVTEIHCSQVTEEAAIPVGGRLN